MELSHQDRLENLPKRPKCLGINKKWVQRTCPCNFYTIEFKQNMKNIYQYSFECQPPLPEQSRQLLIQVIKNAESELKKEIGIFSYKGNMIWGLKQAKTTVVTVKSFVFLGEREKQKGKEEHLVQLKIARVFDLYRDSFITDFGKKILQVLNIKFKESLRNREYIEITRNKYYTKNEFQDQKDNVFDQLNLRVLRGFSFTFVPLFEHNLKARLNLSNKYIQQRNFLELLKDCDSRDAQRHLIGRYVMAYYGNFKLYKIEDIDYEKNPLSQFSLTNQQKTMTYKDYYLLKYDKKIYDMKQPLLKVVLKIEKKKKEGGKIQEIPTYAYMIPQLVKLSGVIDEQAEHKDFKNVVKAMRKSPHQTNVACEAIREEFQDICKDSVFQVGQQLRVKGYQLPRVDYQTTGRKTCQKEQINVLQKIMNPMTLNQGAWMMIFGHGNQHTALKILDSMKFAKNKLGITIQDPISVQVNQRGEKKFTEKVRLIVKEHKPKFVVVILNRNEQHYYGGLKKLFINELNIGSQFIKSGTVFQKIKQHKSILPIVTKVLLQINAKLGLPVWKIFKKNDFWKKKSVMICALGLKKSTKQKSKFTLSFVGSSNEQMTEFYSDCQVDIRKIDGNLPKAQLLKLFTEWIRNYIDNEQKIADCIICYREGSSEFQIIQQSEIQIQALKQAIEICQEKKKTPPSVVYVHVNKKTDTKFYESENNGKGTLNYTNPLPGTVILEDLSQGDAYDFHMMAQKVNQGTGIPTYYKVLFNDSEIPEDALVELTHEQCYNYVNWAGPVRVPSCLQYVSKLSSLMTEYIKEPLSCSEKFKRKLFFL